MDTLTATQKPVTELAQGDLIMTGIMSEVLAVHNYADETSVFVEDVNGFRYHSRFSPSFVIDTYPHLREAYDDLHTYVTNDDPSTGQYWKED